MHDFDWQDFVNKEVKAPDEPEISEEFKAAAQALGKLKRWELFALLSGSCEGAKEIMVANGRADYALAFLAAEEAAVNVTNYLLDRNL